MNSARSISRRQFLQTSAAAGAIVAGQLPQSCRAEAKNANKVCAFTKPFNELSFDELADRLAEIGFDGVEVPVRPGGNIEPEQVADELPRLVEVLSSRGLTVEILTLGVKRLSDPYAAEVLTTAARLGINYYRMGYLEYDLNADVIEQLDSFRPDFRDLIQYSRELGITPLYQNHCGRQLVGAPLWDIWYLLKEDTLPDFGVAFDLGHATIEGGESWPIQFNLLEDYIAAHYVKDFVWDGSKVRWVPLGEGRVDGTFYQRLRGTFHGPISIHVEYLDHANPTMNELFSAIERDRSQLRRWLQG